MKSQAKWPWCMACPRIVGRLENGRTGLASAIKRTLLASETLRPDVAEQRRVWVEIRQPDLSNMLEMLVVIDETSLKTNLVKTTGWAPVGARRRIMPPLATGTARPSLRGLAATVWWHLGSWTAL